jgi:hypothetical protein
MSEWVQQCRTAAAIMVCGFTINRYGKPEPRTGHWGPAWLEHGLVRKAERDGWGRELRAYATNSVATRIMQRTTGRSDGVMPAFEDVVRDVGDFLPTDTRWIDYHSERAAKYEATKEARPPVDHGLVDRLVAELKKHPDRASALLRIAMGVPQVSAPAKAKWPDVSREAFEGAQRSSRNGGMHRDVGIDYKRRAAGDRD